MISFEKILSNISEQLANEKPELVPVLLSKWLDEEEVERWKAIEIKRIEAEASLLNSLAKSCASKIRETKEDKPKKEQQGTTASELWKAGNLCGGKHSATS